MDSLKCTLTLKFEPKTVIRKLIPSLKQLNHESLLCQGVKIIFSRISVYLVGFPTVLYFNNS